MIDADRKGMADNVSKCPAVGSGEPKASWHRPAYRRLETSSGTADVDGVGGDGEGEQES